MGTQANTFVDLVFESLDARGFVTHMRSIAWRGWIRPADLDPDDNRTPDNFDPVRVCFKWLTDDPLSEGICACRMTVDDWSAWKRLGLPAAMDIMSEKDPFAALRFADPENPTEAEREANNPWYEISQDDTKVAQVRKRRPEKDAEGNNQGLATTRFDERTNDFRGKNEPARVAAVR